MVLHLHGNHVHGVVLSRTRLPLLSHFSVRIGITVRVPSLSSQGTVPPVLFAPGPPALLPLLCPLLSDQSLLRGSRAWDPASLSLFLARSFSHLILSIICALNDSEMSASRKVAISRSSGLTYPTALMLGPQVKSWVSMWPAQLSMPSAPCPRVPFPVQ